MRLSARKTKPEAFTRLSILIREYKKHMKYIVRVIAVATVMTLGAWTALSAEEENEQVVKMSDLPAAVQTTIKDKAATNEIEKIEKKKENAKTTNEPVVEAIVPCSPKRKRVPC